MNELEKFLTVGPFKRLDGASVELHDFRREFTKWLDCPSAQMFWAQHQRIEKVLRSLNIPIGYQKREVVGLCSTTSGRLVVGNLGTHVPPGARTLVVEDGHLLPVDFK